MPVARTFQNNFTSGEISPDLNARIDVKQYANGCHQMLNALPTLEGGWTGRPGFQYLFHVRDESQEAHFIDFVYSTDISYGVVINDGYMWFLTERSLITETAQSIVTCTDNGSGLIRVEITGHGYTTGDWVQIVGVTGTYEANSEWEITVIGANTFDLVGSTFTNAWVDGGLCGKIVEVACPYTESDLHNLRWAQDGDVLYIVNGAYIPYKLSRTSATSFTLEKFFMNGPYRETGTDAAGFQTSATTLNWSSATLTKGTTGTLVAVPPAAQNITDCVDNGSGLIRVTIAGHGYDLDAETPPIVTIAGVTGTTEANGDWKITVVDIDKFDLIGSTFTNTYSGPSGTSTIGVFWSTDVDRCVKYEGDGSAGKTAGTVRGALKITGYTDPLNVSAEIIETLTGTTATTLWSLGKWNTYDGWPAAVTFHEQRLVLGGAALNPQEWCGSFLNAPVDYVGDEPTNNDDSYCYTVRSERINSIRWIHSLANLLIGTAGEELEVFGPSDLTIGPVISPIIKPQTKRGSNETRPLVFDDVVLFVQWGGRRLYTLEYDTQKDKLGGQDLTFISRHLVPSGTSIHSMAFEEQPNNTVWLTRTDGVLLSMIYFPEQEVLGWSQHTTQDGLFEDVMCLPSVPTGKTDTYVTVKRTINGVTRRYVEVANRDMYVDSGISGSFNSSDGLVNGLNHLANEQVVQNIDGGVGVGPVTVSLEGQIDVSPRTSGTIQAGLAFTPTVTPLEPLMGTTATSNDQFFGRKKKYGAIIIRSRNTKTFAVDGQQLPARDSGDLMDTTPPADTLKDWRLSQLGYKTINSIVISQPLPLPIHILSIAGTVSIGEL